MIQVFADDKLIYDSRLEETDLLALKATRTLNSGGKAEIAIPYNHPNYNDFVWQKTVVKIYRDGDLRFRGRAIYPTDTFTGQRAVTCEGELCFLRDTIHRPYSYQDTPQACFVSLISQHNNAADDWKQFQIGNVTVTDPNGWIKLESESAEPTLTTLNKLIDRCGGYIVFSDDPVTGHRIINWLEKLERRSDQKIEFGENLLDFSRTGASTTQLATGLVPYGAKDEKTKKRITIESVNDGKDYILANDAVAVRDHIFVTKTWDDVTSPDVLLSNATAWLNEIKLFITSLELTAFDLSYYDLQLDSFSVGDLILVVSVPHGVNELFQLIQMTEDFLKPTKSKIVLGKDIASLTGAGAASDFQAQAAIESVKTSYGANVDAVVSAVKPVSGGVYLSGSAVVSSDQRYENSAETLPEAYATMLDNLVPMRFRYNSGGDTYHVGFVAQDVATAMTAAGLTQADFGGFVDVNGDGSVFGLAYDEFIGLLLQKIRNLENRLDSMEE